MSVCTNLTCTAIQCNDYSVTGCLPMDFITESCFTTSYCDRFPNCTLLNELYSEYISNYTCYNIAAPSVTLPNNSLQLTPKLFMLMLIVWLLSLF